MKFNTPGNAFNHYYNCVIVENNTKVDVIDIMESWKNERESLIKEVRQAVSERNQWRNRKLGERL